MRLFSSPHPQLSVIPLDSACQSDVVSVDAAMCSAPNRDWDKT